MKITDNTTDGRMKFFNLDVGECFKFPSHGDEIFMRIEDTEDYCRGGENFRAVSLTEGAVCRGCEDEDEVILVDTELFVNFH